VRQTVPALPAAFWHAPATHESTVHTFESSQLTVLHVVPQLVVELITRSQPFSALPSQSSVPVAQATHAPAVQVWPAPHTALEQPQLALVLDFSQPFAALPSQSIMPAEQAVHDCDAHVCDVVQAVALAQVVPQLASVLRARSQPSVPPLQSPYPSLQVRLSDSLTFESVGERSSALWPLLSLL
jgi:hypothetical protein